MNQAVLHGSCQLISVFFGTFHWSFKKGPPFNLPGNKANIQGLSKGL